MKAALDYGRLGWSVIPIESGGKRPLIHWEVYQHRRPDMTEVADWFQRWPDANIAIVTGVVSRLVVLELDPKQGADAWYRELECAHGPVAETVETRTGGGGCHLYFAHPGEILHNRVGIAPGVELRGDGGYVVAPPSVHSSAESYRWERSPRVCRLAPLPDWLWQTLEEQGNEGHRLSHWQRLLRDGVAQGERNDTIASLAGYLLRHGVDPDVTTELLLTWNATRCRPPLEPEEVARIIDSIARLHLPGETA